MTYACKYESPMGTIRLTSDGVALTGLWLEGQRGAELAMALEEQQLPVFQETKDWLDRYFQGTDPGAIPAIAMEGTPFRKLVWQLLLTIPYGQTMTYGEIAAQVVALQGKKRMSAQAVGGAVGHNPISILVPCHRVVGANGNLTGYGGGLDKKVQLLALEGVELSRFFMPEERKMM